MSLSRFPWNIHLYLRGFQQPKWSWLGTTHEHFQGNGITGSHGVTFTRNTENCHWLIHKVLMQSCTEALWLQLGYQFRAVTFYIRLQHCLWILLFLKRMKENGPTWEQALLLLPGGVTLLWPHPAHVALVASGQVASPTPETPVHISFYEAEYTVSHMGNKTI